MLAFSKRVHVGYKNLVEADGALLLSTVLTRVSLVIGSEVVVGLLHRGYDTT
jgi:hypothetical protein